MTRELARGGPYDPVGAILLPILERLHLEWQDPEKPRDPETEEFLMTTYEAWYKKVFAEGEARGEVRGEARGEARSLLAVLSVRGLAVNAEQAARIQGCGDSAKLETWLRRAVSASSTEEVLRDES